MSPSRRDKDYLGDIVEAIQRIFDYTAGLTYEQFLTNTMVQDAVIRNLQIIGEAAKQLSRNVTDGHPKIPWRQMAGTRDRVVHDYFRINYEIVWNIVRDELPALLPRIEAIHNTVGEE
jgi:uncharacterized protein with HEPN domain